MQDIDRACRGGDAVLGGRHPPGPAAGSTAGGQPPAAARHGRLSLPLCWQPHPPAPLEDAGPGRLLGIVFNDNVNR